MARHSRAKRGIPSENDGMHPSAGFANFQKNGIEDIQQKILSKYVFFLPRIMVKISQKPGIEDLSRLEFVENTNKDAFATALVMTPELKVHQVFIFSDM